MIVFHPFFLIFVRYVNTELQSDDDRNIQHLSLFCMFSLCLTVVIDLPWGSFSAGSSLFPCVELSLIRDIIHDVGLGQSIILFCKICSSFIFNRASFAF